MSTENKLSRAAEVAQEYFELLNECAATSHIHAALHADFTADCLFHEVVGLLDGIAEGVIQKGQPRLREAIMALAEASKSWGLPRGDSSKLETPLDKFYDTLSELVYLCSCFGLAVADVSFDPHQRQRPSSPSRGA